MIDCFNQILGLIINIAIISGICSLIYFYWRVKSLDSRIEKFHHNFEKDRDLSRVRHVPMPFIDKEINMLSKKMDEGVAPLDRERQRIISKIPFLK